MLKKNSVNRSLIRGGIWKAPLPTSQVQPTNTSPTSSLPITVQKDEQWSCTIKASMRACMKYWGREGTDRNGIQKERNPEHLSQRLQLYCCASQKGCWFMSTTNIHHSWTMKYPLPTHTPVHVSKAWFLDAGTILGDCKTLGDRA